MRRHVTLHRVMPHHVMLRRVMRRHAMPHHAMHRRRNLVLKRVEFFIFFPLFSQEYIMKKRLLNLLICPVCLPREIPLKSIVFDSADDDIISGELTCQICGGKYHINEGVAFLVSEMASACQRGQDRYEENDMLSSYCWTHYGDLLDETEANDAYSYWGSNISLPGGGLALDAGCSLGRFTFEMSRKSDFVIGIDLSESFVRHARKLMLDKSMNFPLITEGRLFENRLIRLPESFDTNKVEFIVGDALALPFSKKSFSFVSSLNLLDKLPRPLDHLKEINRVAKINGAEFLFSDPFSWSVEAAEEKDWLGGKREGEYSGKGIDNVKLLLQGKNGLLSPPWRIEKQGAVSWKIRNHSNHYEMIRSQFIVSSR